MTTKTNLEIGFVDDQAIKQKNRLENTPGIQICDGAKTGYEPRNSRDKNFTTANNVLMFSQPQLRFLKSNSEKINTKSPSA